MGSECIVQHWCNSTGITVSELHVHKGGGTPSSGFLGSFSACPYLVIGRPPVHFLPACLRICSWLVQHNPPMAPSKLIYPFAFALLLSWLRYDCLSIAPSAFYSSVPLPGSGPCSLFVRAPARQPQPEESAPVGTRLRPRWGRSLNRHALH